MIGAVKPITDELATRTSFCSSARFLKAYSPEREYFSYQKYYPKDPNLFRSQITVNFHLTQKSRCLRHFADVLANQSTTQKKRSFPSKAHAQICNTEIQMTSNFALQPLSSSDCGPHALKARQTEASIIDRNTSPTPVWAHWGTFLEKVVGNANSLRSENETFSSGSVLRVKVLGSFDVLHADGTSIRPTVRKACGLLAILALSTGHRQSRKWIQSQLWSNSSEAKGAGSLRQELARLKRLLGDAIVSDNLDIWLDADQFEFDHLSKKLAAGVELLQGIDVGDEAFEDWLREQRQSAMSATDDDDSDLPARPNTQPTRDFVFGQRRQNCTVIFDTTAKGNLDADVAAMFFSEQLHRSLKQYDVFSCVTLDSRSLGAENHRAAVDRRAVIVRISAFAYGDEVCLGVELDSGFHGRRLDLKSIVVPPGISQLRASNKIGGLVHHTVETLLENVEFDMLPTGATGEALMLAQHARKLTFQLGKQSLLAAEDLLKQAYELDPRGQYIAWRGFLRNTAFFQHRDADIFEESYSSDVLTLEALHQAPDNAIVQAFSSQIDYINQGNLAEPMHKAERAVQLDPTDPMARALLSNALTVNGRLNEGYEVALQAITLSAGGLYEFYFHHFACMAATAAHSYETALSHARASTRNVSHFVSPRRYEVALANHLGDRPSVDHAVEAMRVVEPDFELHTLLDPIYPVNTLRRLPIIETIS